jgi:SAM-dependent methyltransferase
VEWGEGCGRLFDSYTSDYETVLNRALAASGEKLEYFARVRIERLSKILKALKFRPDKVLDYGCGAGTATPFFQAVMQPSHLLGVDVSPEAVRVARQKYGGRAVEFALCHEVEPRGQFDVAFCNGVFHHIAPEERRAALGYIYEALRPGGLFALWENNPWNPGTRYIMSRCEFDRGAAVFSHWSARALLRSQGFEVVHSSSYFYFPHWLSWLRAMEPALAYLPLGGQYVVVGRR